MKDDPIQLTSIKRSLRYEEHVGLLSNILNLMTCSGQLELHYSDLIYHTYVDLYKQYLNIIYIYIIY